MATVAWEARRDRGEVLLYLITRRDSKHHMCMLYFHVVLMSRVERDTMKIPRFCLASLTLMFYMPVISFLKDNALMSDVFIFCL